MHDHGPVQAAPPRTATSAERGADEDRQSAPSHSMWWMVACCAPMVLLALAILVGVFGSR